MRKSRVEVFIITHRYPGNSPLRPVFRYVVAHFHLGWDLVDKGFCETPPEIRRLLAAQLRGLTPVQTLATTTIDKRQRFSVLLANYFVKGYLPGGTGMFEPPVN